MDLKAAAAERALQYVTHETYVLGLGTGSTAEKLLEELAEQIKSGRFKKLIGVPTSLRTAAYAKRLGIPIKELDEVSGVDITIDGADEVDAKLNLIKGAGGALTREKLVASASRQLVIVVDESKRVERLGTRFSLPIEVLPFGWTHICRRLEKLGSKPELRQVEGKPFITDQGNYILDCKFANGISDPNKLERQLNDLAGVVEHGLFLEMAHCVVVAQKSGVVVLEKERLAHR